MALLIYLNRGFPLNGSVVLITSRIIPRGRTLPASMTDRESRFYRNRPPNSITLNKFVCFGYDGLRPSTRVARGSHSHRAQESEGDSFFLSLDGPSQDGPNPRTCRGTRRARRTGIPLTGRSAGVPGCFLEVAAAVSALVAGLGPATSAPSRALAARGGTAGHAARAPRGAGRGPVFVAARADTQGEGAPSVDVTLSRVFDPPFNVVGEEDWFHRSWTRLREIKARRK